MPRIKIDWRIQYLGKQYHIKLWRNVYIIEREINGIHRASRAKRLKQMIHMWSSTGFGMKPGEFITKITGQKCIDLS